MIKFFQKVLRQGEFLHGGVAGGEPTLLRVVMAGARKGRPYGCDVNFTDTMCPTPHPSFALQNPPSPKGEGYAPLCEVRKSVE